MNILQHDKILRFLSSLRNDTHAFNVGGKRGVTNNEQIDSACRRRVFHCSPSANRSFRPSAVREKTFNN